MGLVAWVKKSKIQQKYFKKLFHMGEEASLKDKGSAADLPMLDKETLPPQGLQIPTLPHAKKNLY